MNHSIIGCDGKRSYHKGTPISSIWCRHLLHFTIQWGKIRMEGKIRMKLSVCVDAVYSGRDFAESVKEVSQIGYDTIEFWAWWKKDIEAVQAAVLEAGVSISIFCTKFVSLVDPSMRSTYLEGLTESIATAKRLNCTRLISQVGQDLVGVSRE
ncbi:hypothetical protein D3C85_1204990 [compost metagenome]